jgi:hypothetical protein
MAAKIVKQDTWEGWRGSPDLFAQLVRVVMRSAEAGASTPVSCTIDVEVIGDHEVFSSPPEFARDVTPDALRRFTRIDVKVNSDVLDAHFRLHWLRPWWSWKGEGDDAEVFLQVEAPSEAAADSAFQTIAASIRRGQTRSDNSQIVIGTAIGLVLIGATVWSALYLLKISSEVISIVLGIVSLVGLFGGFLAAAWIYPSLEIAPPGRTNLALLVKFAGPLIAAFILTGAGKALYG